MPVTFFSRLVTLTGMLYMTQYQCVSPGPGTWCMTTAKVCVPVGAPLHAKGNVALAPSHVYSTGSAPPSVTSELLRLNVPFEDVTASAVDMSTVESLDGGVGGSPGLVEQPAKSRETIMSIENIFAFINLNHIRTQKIFD